MGPGAVGLANLGCVRVPQTTPSASHSARSSRSSVVGRRTSDVGRRTSVVGRRSSVVRLRSSVVCRRSSVFGWLSPVLIHLLLPKDLLPLTTGHCRALTSLPTPSAGAPPGSDPGSPAGGGAAAPGPRLPAKSPDRPARDTATPASARARAGKPAFLAKGWADQLSRIS